MTPTARRHALLRLASGAAALAMAGAAPVAGGATPQKVSKAVAARVRSVIEAQLAAFAADDAERAFSYAAPSIRELFGGAGAFIAMVRSRYPVVYRPASVDFLEPLPRQRDVLQAVRMADADGAVWIAVYVLERQRGGAWRIAGCELRREARQAT